MKNVFSDEMHLIVSRTSIERIDNGNARLDSDECKELLQLS